LIDDLRQQSASGASLSTGSSSITFSKKNLVAGRIDKTSGRCAIFAGRWMAYVDHRN
jgi:hypothetical protein